MAFIPTPPGTAKLVVNGLLNNEPVVNIHYYTSGDDSPLTSADLASLGTRFMAAWWPVARVQLSVNYILSSVEVFDASQQGGAYAVIPATDPTGGVVTGNSLPANAAFVVTKRTGRAGRSYRGRTYIAGLSESLTDGNFVAGVFTSAQVAALGAARDLPGVAPDRSWLMAIASFMENKVPRAVAVMTPVLVVEARDNRVDTQRRRLPR